MFYYFMVTSLCIFSQIFECHFEFLIMFLLIWISGLILSFGTLGRLIHILEPQYKYLQKVINIVLDDDDHMIDMSFEPHIMKIISQVHISCI